MKKIALLILLFSSGFAHAYPSYIVKGYTNCGSCHYSPTGGGFPNSYGYAAQSATYPDAIHSTSIENWRSRFTKSDVTGYKEDKTPTFQWSLGLDARALLLFAKNGNGEDEGGGEDGGGGGATRQPLLIPMLFEVGGVAAYGPWITYGTITPRRAGAGQAPNAIFSREHWLGYKFNDASMIRAGRMVLPFGIRSPDHTLYTRQDFGFDKWDQSYGVEWDLSTERWMIATAGFAGDLILDPTRLQQRGGVASISYNFPGKATVGTSFLASASSATHVLQGAIFSRAKFLEHFYVMEEVGLRKESSTENLGTNKVLATTFRLGIFPIESLDIYFEAAVRRIFNQGVLDKARYTLGSQWQILPWVELIPAVMLEDFNSTKELTPMAQLHMIF